MRRWLIRLTLFALLLAPTAWFVLNNPLAWPLLKTGAAGVAARIEAQMDRAISDGTLERRLAEAVAEGDAPAADRLYRLAEARERPLPADLAAETRALTGAEESWVDDTVSCLRCASEIQSCRSLWQVASCALPMELTPLGDLNALRRQAQNAATGVPVDRVEAGLAAVGIAATGAVIVTGGASGTVKAGATLGRVSRRFGSMTPGFARALGDAADVPIAWSRVDDLVLRRVTLDAVTDTARLERLAGYARDIGGVTSATSLTDTLVLLRHVETGTDLSRLARVSEAAGTRTADAFALLGKSRVFRALDEVGALVRWCAALGATLALQAALWLLRTGLRRGLRAA